MAATRINSEYYCYIIAKHISARLWIGDLFSQSTYVRTYVRGGSRSGMSRGMSLHTGYTIGTRYGPYVHHTVWHIQIRSTQILFSVFWWWRWRSRTRGHRGLDTTTPNSFYSKFANVTRATRASASPAFMTRACSLRTCTRQRCACVFLVLSQ